MARLVNGEETIERESRAAHRRERSSPSLFESPEAILSDRDESLSKVS
jgi:hypothetical protein